MAPQKIWAPLKANQKTLDHTDGAFSQEEFSELIQYERMRADRTESRFTLILLELDLDSVTRYTTRRFMATLFLNMRDTDYIGWYSENRIGVLLTDTTVSGAQAFMKNIHDNTNEFNIVSSIEVTMYPRVSNIQIVIDDEEESIDYYSTYDKKLEELCCKLTPVWKRSVDIIVGLVGGLLFLPVLLLVPLLILITSPGPIFYTQDRVGLGGKTFRIFKFRTMKIGNNTSTHSQHLMNLIKEGDSMKKLDKSDPRIIPGGTIIRIFGFDELPQLINIFKGEMSLVGPRPCIPYEAELYLHWHKKRFDIVPGLTGLWQVSGKNRLSFQEMIRLDIQYAERMSLRFDLFIIMKTIPTMIAGMVRTRLENRKIKLARS